MDKTCCPSYTIRLKASDFVPSKEQHRVCKRIERFLDGQLDAKPRDQTEDPSTSSPSEISDSSRKKLMAVKKGENSKVEPIMNDLSEQIDNSVQICVQSGEFPSYIQVPKASVKKVLAAKMKQLAEGPEELLYTSNIAFQIAAAIKCTQASEKEERNSGEENRLSPAIISEKLAQAMNQLGEIPGVSVKACKGHINFFAASKVSSFDRDVPFGTISKGANSLCDDKSLCATKSSKSPQTRKRKLEILLKRSSFDPEEHELYKRYQLRVHNDKPEHITESSYRRFLVDTPLIEVPPSGDDKVPPCGFGSFHQQYRVDGRLIAVGVIDILPKCLSSKYLFWDPDYAFLSVGKYSALQEINWIKENEAPCPTLQYYYLGYYIHSCSKMRYKAAYHPSELLCPLRYQWVPYEIARPLLDKKRYVILSDYTNSRCQDSLLPLTSETLVESMCEHQDVEPGETRDRFLDNGEEDEEMDEAELEDSDSDSDPENNTFPSSAEDNDISNILIGLSESRFRYKELKPMMNPVGRRHLEPRLHSYKKVVGTELSERMAYELR
ncbi:PREDICTED: arginyl-tRNA--protein transferase 1 isoform X1 [Tarenaya hassleriana]|nr:PREDICTED: arginyl-tRNA--protein transferase 1 isoform X1 [Tarenaya hassleriana]